MNKKGVETYLNKGFAERFQNAKPKKDKRRFVFIFEDIYIHFGYGVVDNDNSFPTSFSYKIGSFQLRDLLVHILPEKYDLSKYPLSIGIGQPSLFDKGKYDIVEYDICTELDAKRMVEEVSNYMLNYVLPEWKENSSVEYLERIVNKERNDVPNFSGLILSRLVNSDSYLEVKEYLLEVSNTWSDWDRKDLRKVLDFLETHSPEEINELISKPNY